MGAIFKSFIILSLICLPACSPKAGEKRPPVKKSAAAEKIETLDEGNKSAKDQSADVGSIRVYGGAYLISKFGEYCIEEFSSKYEFAKDQCKANSDCKWLAECPIERVVKGCPTKSSKQVSWHYDNKEIQACPEKIVKNRNEAAEYFGMAETIASEDASADIFTRFVSVTLTKEYRSEIIVAAKTVDVILKKGTQHLVTDFSSGKYSIPYLTNSGVYDVEIDESKVRVSGTFNRLKSTNMAMRSVGLFKDKELKTEACTLGKYEVLPSGTALTFNGSGYTLESDSFPRKCASRVLYAGSLR